MGIFSWIFSTKKSPPLRATLPVINTAIKGKLFRVSPLVTGGKPSYKMTLVKGKLPPGLTIDPSRGIVGTPK